MHTPAGTTGSQSCSIGELGRDFTGVWGRDGLSTAIGECPFSGRAALLGGGVRGAPETEATAKPEVWWWSNCGNMENEEGDPGKMLKIPGLL